MDLSLPAVVETYFDISNGGDIARIGDCFRTDARVRDEHRTHCGIDAIRAWQQAARQAFSYRVEPLEATQQADRLLVRARVAGDFPGSPVALNHVFLLEQGRIRSLEITS